MSSSVPKHSPRSAPPSDAPARSFRRPEILAPAGNRDMMRAAVENGADAVYFGLDAFNARLRAHNFPVAELPDLMAWLHERGVKGYVTLNTLIFPSELPEAASLLRACSEAGVDAVIVQDLGLAALAARLVPDLPVHASTQMTLTCAESIEAAEALGLRLERVVAPRENNLKELAKITRATPRELEVFVHGAICVAYSGQCLTSEALGGRSANRGECAQACRLPYDLVVDGQARDLGDVKYLLSPKDLAAYADLDGLVRAGIASLKIEGRLKSPQYVAATVQSYRAALDQIFSAPAGGGNGAPSDGTGGGDGLGRPRMSEETRRRLEMTFSRGFTGGYLHETNHQAVVEGRFPKKRGLYLGQVTRVDRRGVTVRLEAPLRPGDGVVFDAGRPEEEEEGGRVYALSPAPSHPATPPAQSTRSTRSALATQSTRSSRTRAPRSPRPTSPAAPSAAPHPSAPVSPSPGAPAEVLITFGEGRVNLRRVRPGDRVWKTSDPELDRELTSTYEGDQIRWRRPVRATVQGRPGRPLVLILEDEDGRSVRVEDTAPAEHARHQPLGREALEKQIGRLGNTPFRLEELRVELEGDVLVPFSRLNDLRRRAVEALVAERRRAGHGRRANPDALDAMRRAIRPGTAAGSPLSPGVASTLSSTSTQATLSAPPEELPASPVCYLDEFADLLLADAPQLAVLCRTLEQVEAAASHPGVAAVYTDFEDPRRTRDARALVPRRRADGGSGPLFAPATLRVIKPGEIGFTRQLLQADPDALLVRNLASWHLLRRERPDLTLLGDYSLNVANDLTAALLRQNGFAQLTPSYDLNIDQLLDLLRAAPPEWFEVTIHQRLPMFHMEHCVFCRFLSSGTNHTNCGRPCDTHTIRLRDRMGYEHPVKADAGCRNTVYNAVPQSASEYLPQLRQAGVFRFRIELIDEDAATTRRIIDAYLPALRGECDGRKLWRDLKASSKLGVTRGSLDHE